MALLLAAVLRLAAAPGHAQENLTLRDLVEEAGLVADATLAEHLEERVTSGSQLTLPTETVIASYVVSECDRCPRPLHIWRFDAATRRWSHAAHELQRLGSVLSIHRVGRFLLVELHHTPSSTTDLVLSADLAVHAQLDGHMVLALDDRRVVLRRGQPHFSWVYETVLDLYDLELRQALPLFPPVPPSPFRRQLADAAGAAFASAGWDWCAGQNHPCDARLLTSYLDRPLVYDAESDALAFTVSYDLEPLVREPSAYESVVYVYRGLLSGGTVEIRETPLGKDAPLGEEELRGLASPLRADAPGPAGGG